MGGQGGEVAVIGAGPAGLMAAEVLAGAGLSVTVYDRMPSPARKLLMAGRGGLNLTHSEPIERFLDRYGDGRSLVEAAIRDFTPGDVERWSQGLGQETFTGSSGRVFPRTLKASPLLRAWLKRLDGAGVLLVRGTRWTGWSVNGTPLFVDTAGREFDATPTATLLALGGASWPRLGSDGGWVETMRTSGIPVAPLVASNCGIAIAWSDLFRSRSAGQPLKRIAITLADKAVRGEAVITASGLEGGAVYALSSAIRRALGGLRAGPTTISIDLRPDEATEALAARLATPRGKQSISTHLRKALRLSPIEIGLLREASAAAGASASGRFVLPPEAADLARLIKAVPLNVIGMSGLERAISSAGGIRRDAVDHRFMLKAKPGVFVAGEMLDWDAPTGGYLLQATLSTAVAAAHGLASWVAQRDGARHEANATRDANSEHDERVVSRVGVEPTTT